MFAKRYKLLRSAGGGGFTLIELMVVIAIMMTLMSILLPSLSRAREAGKRVVCLSNLRQMTMAWHFYAGDNDEQLCSPDTFWNDTDVSKYWAADGPVVPSNNIGGTKAALKGGVLWSYTERTADLYKCRADRTDLLRSYSISNTMGGYARDGTRPFHTMADITQAPERAVFVDAGSRLQWIAGSFWPMHIDDDGVEWEITDWHNITSRHGGGFNMSFADFHTEYYKWRDGRTEELSYWEISADDASGGNQDLKHVVRLLRGR